MTYIQEVEALQRWIYHLTSVRSFQLSDAPPKVARPVILWEIPGRSSGRRYDNFTRLKTSAQYGKLYVKSLAQYGEIISLLEKDLHNKNNELPVYSTSETSGTVIGSLIDVDFETGTAQNLDIPITIRYNAVHEQDRPDLPGPATAVFNRVTIKTES